MRITFLLSRFLNGGIDTVIVRYLQYLANHNYDLQLIVATEYKGLQPFESEIPSNVEVKYLLSESILTSLAKKKLSSNLNPAEKVVDAIFLSPIRRFLTQIRLHKYLKTTDVVIDFDSRSYSFLKSEKCKKIAFFHFSINKYHGGNDRKLARLCSKMANYDNIVLICNKMAEEFIQRAPQLKSKISIIYNPIDEQQIKRKALEYNVPDVDYILSVGRLAEQQKDFTTLIKAYAKTWRINHNIPPLYIIGDGRNRKDLEALAKNENVAEQVKFLGYLTNPMPWIAKAKLFILSSKFEGLPTVLIEALMLNRVIIATDCPTGPAEILDYGKCGFLVPIGDDKLLSKAIIDALFDESSRDSLLSNVLEHQKVFTPEVIIPKLIELF